MPNYYSTVKDVFDGMETYNYYSSSGVVAGDMMQWDAVSRVATPMTTASGAIFLGVSEDASPLAGIGTAARPLVAGGRVRIKSQGVFNMKTTSGETYSHLDPLFMGADPQTVSKIGSGRCIGRAHLPGGNTVSGGSTTRVNVRIFGSMTNCGQAPSALDGDR